MAQDIMHSSRKFFSKGSQVVGAWLLSGLSLLPMKGFSQNAYFGNITVGEDSLPGFSIMISNNDTTITTDDLGNYFFPFHNVSISDEGPNIALKNDFRMKNPTGNDLVVFADYSGNKENIDFKVVSITGRDETDCVSPSNGIYFLTLTDNGKLLKCLPFTYDKSLGRGGFNFSFKDKPRNLNNPNLKSLDDVFTFSTNDTNGIMISPESVDYVVPQGLVEWDFHFDRVLRQPNLIISDSVLLGTINEEYIIDINASSFEFDSDSVVINIEQTGGDSSFFTFENGQFRFTPSTRDNYFFRVSAIDYPHLTESSINVFIRASSQVYQVIFTELFGNLGGPAPGLQGSLQNQTAISDSSGLMTFEFPDGSLNGNEHIIVTNPSIGSIQEGTGRFYNLDFKINLDNIDSVMTVTDPFDSTYWSQFPYSHLLQALTHHFMFDLLGPDENHKFCLERQGELSTGKRFITGLYSPEFSSWPGYPEYDLDYRINVDTLINQIINPTFFDFAGNGNNPSRLILLPLGEEYLAEATDHGHVFDYSHTYSHTVYYTQGDDINELYFIKWAHEWIKNNFAADSDGNPEVRRHMAKEIMRGYGALRATPYYPDLTMDIMRGGPLQPHNIAEMYIINNHARNNLRNIQNYSEILPYTTTTTTTNNLKIKHAQE